MAVKWTDEKIDELIQTYEGNASAAARALGANQRYMQGRFNARLGNRGSGVLQAFPPPKVGEEISRTELLQQENIELKKQVAAARKLEVFDYRALQLLEQSIQAIEPKFKTPTVIGDPKLEAHAHVLQWGDLHAAERVFYDAMGGLNEYNYDILLKRHEAMATAVVSFKENRPYPINELFILGMGDMVTGDIHDELRETNEMVCTETAVQIGLDGAAFIESLAPHYDLITVAGVSGNHGRITRKPEFKNPHKSWDWIAYTIMELRLRGHENVEVEIPKSFDHLVQVFDKNILMFHGDGIPTTMPGVPWGGVQRRVKEMYATWAEQGIQVDHFALGHFHEANVINQKRIWVNGSVIGQSEYGLKRYGGGAAPCQLLHTFHPKRGLVSTDYLML